MSHRPSRRHPTPTTEQAAALIAEVERTLAEGQQQLRAMGLDPAKVRALGERLTPKLETQAQAALQADQAAVEQEVAEARARLASASAPAPAVRVPRGFV